MSSEAEAAPAISVDKKTLRKLHKKETMQKQRLNRQHDPQSIQLHQKKCDSCQHLKDILIRCQADDTEKWYMLCTAGCWQKASDGKVDGTSAVPRYRYGGM